MSGTDLCDAWYWHTRYGIRLAYALPGTDLRITGYQEEEDESEKKKKKKKNKDAGSASGTSYAICYVTHTLSDSVQEGVQYCAVQVCGTAALYGMVLMACTEPAAGSSNRKFDFYSETEATKNLAASKVLTPYALPGTILRAARYHPTRVCWYETWYCAARCWLLHYEELVSAISYWCGLYRCGRGNGTVRSGTEEGSVVPGGGVPYRGRPQARKLLPQPHHRLQV
eukprot:3439405-Rhodomonas_salina.1